MLHLLGSVTPIPNAYCSCIRTNRGCKINPAQPPPNGYKCNCKEKNERWSISFRKVCHGEAQICPSYNDYGCNGCKEKECCKGNCGGHHERASG